MNSSLLAERISSIEKRLDKIESNLNKESSQSLYHVEELMPNINSEKDTIISYEASAKRYGNLLGVVAVICFVLAAGFMVKLSLEFSWFSNEKKICLGGLFGLTLIFSRPMLLKLDNEYASLLPGSGIIILYLTTFIAYLYYSLISFKVAISLVCIVSALCIWLYKQSKHTIYAITASVGAYLSPLFVDFSSNAVFFLYYFVLCSITFSCIAVWIRLRTLITVSIYLAMVMNSLVGLALTETILIHEKLMPYILCLHFLVFALCTYIHSRLSNTSFVKKDAVALLPALLIFYIAEYYFIDLAYHSLTPWILLGFGAILVSVYILSKKYFLDSTGSEYLVLAFITIACFHSLYFEILSPILRSWVFVVIVLINAFLPYTLDSVNKSGGFSMQIFSMKLVLVIEYMFMIYHLFNETTVSTDLLIASFAACISIWVVIINKYSKSEKGTEYYNLSLISTHLLAILGFWHLTKGISSLAVSASWLLYAVSIMLVAYRYKNIPMVRSALFVLILAAGKALLYDAASAATVIRVLCLLFTGVVLYICGFLMRKTDSWSSSDIKIDGSIENEA